MSANIKTLAQIGASEKIVGLVTDALEHTPIVEDNFQPSRRFSAYRKMFFASRRAEARKANLSWKSQKLKAKKAKEISKSRV